MEASPLWPWTETSIPPQAPRPEPSPVTGLTAVTTQMQAALADEIAATKGENQRRVPLTQGALIGQSQAPLPLYAYRFAEAPVGHRAGSWTNLVVGKRTLNAYVMSRRLDHRLVLGVPEHLGPTIEHAELEEDTIWLLRALKTALGQLPGGFNVPLALAAVGEAPVPRVAPDIDVDALLPGISWELNDGQLDALRVGLRAPLGFIWGPPGTGKTATLAALGDAHVAANRRVLLLCPTNRTLDEAVVRLAQRLQQRSALDVGTVVRLGDMAARQRDRCPVPLERELLPPQSVQTCRVLAATVHMAYLNPDLVAGFDAVIVDEAAAMILPLAFWVAGLGRKQVTFIGDHCQLGPVVRASTAAAQHWLKRDVFAASGVWGLIAAEENPVYLGMLRTQYRMAPEISGLVSRLYYDERLEYAVSVLQRRPLPCALTDDNTLVLVDTSGTTPSQPSGSGDGKGRQAFRLANPEHARLVARILHHMAEDMPAPGSVAVLAPYRDQVKLHRATWGEAYTWAVPATVHATQGGEVDVIILDLPDGPPHRVSPFFQGTNRGECARLLNVALSRARYRVIVLANVQWLMKQASAPVRDLLAELRDEYRLPVRDLG